jgi:hypothetical protein
MEKSHVFLITAVDGGEWSAYRSGPGKHWTVGWVGHGTGLIMAF